MRAVRFHGYGDATVLQLDDINTPAIGDDQVLIRVVAAATNILDIALREGQMRDAFPGALPSGQGFDLAGTIVEIGSNVTGFVVGDDVIGWAPRRAQADYVTIDARELAHKPSAVSWAAAASIPPLQPPPTVPCTRSTRNRATPWWSQQPPEASARWSHNSPSTRARPSSAPQDRPTSTSCTPWEPHR